MASLEIVALDPTTPQLRAPGAGNTYAVPRSLVLAAGADIGNGTWFINQFNTASFPTLIGLNCAIGGTAVATGSSAAVFSAGTAGTSSLRINAGVAPTSPVDGDIWYDGTNIKIRVGAITKTFTIV